MQHYCWTMTVWSSRPPKHNHHRRFLSSSLSHRSSKKNGCGQNIENVDNGVKIPSTVQATMRVLQAQRLTMSCVSTPSSRSYRYFSMASHFCHPKNILIDMHTFKRRLPFTPITTKSFSQIPSSFQRTVDTGKDLILYLMEEKQESSLKEATLVWLQLMQVLVNTGIDPLKTEESMAMADILNEVMKMLVTAHAQMFPSTFLSWVQTTLSQIQDIITNTTNTNGDESHINTIEPSRHILDIGRRVIPFNEILSRLHVCPTIEAAHEAHALLQRMIQEECSSDVYTPEPPKSSKLSTFSFNSVLSSWKNALTGSNPTIISLDVETKLSQIWDPMIVLYKVQMEKNPFTVHVYPNRITVHTILTIIRNLVLLRAECNQGSSYTPKASYLYAKCIVQSMLEIYRYQSNARKSVLPSALRGYESGSTSVEHAWKPSNETFHFLLSILGHCGDKQFLKTEVIDILNWMKNIVNEFSDDDVFPDLLIYKSAIGVLLNKVPIHGDVSKRLKKKLSQPSVGSDHMSTIMDIVEEAKDHYGWAGVDNGDDDSSTNLGNFLIVTLANSGHPEEAYNILRRILEESNKLEKSSKLVNAKINVISWNAVMSSFARMGQVDRAVNVLHEIQDYHTAGHEDVRPDNISSTIMLKLLLEENSPTVGEKAVLILERMENRTKEGYIHLKPDIVTYSTVIECLLKTKTKKDTTKAMDILMQRIVEYKRGISDVRPDCRLLKRVSVAALGCLSDSAVASVEALLTHFESDGYMYLDDASEMFDGYSALIHQLCTNSSSYESLFKAEKMLYHLEEHHQKGIDWIYPRTKQYNWVLDALARQCNIEATDRAKKILLNMEKRYKNSLSKMKPDLYSYAAVMLAIANGSSHNDRSSEAEALLQRILDVTQNQSENRLPLQLNSIIFNNALKAIEKSGTNEKVIKVQKIIRCMGDAGVKLDIFTYNGAIRCCAYTIGPKDDKSKAFDYASSLLNELRLSESIKIDLYTYPAMFIACDKLLTNKDDDLQKIKRVFQLCCDDGFVSDIILTQLKKMNIPKGFLAELLQTDDPYSLRLDSLPYYWIRLYRRRNKASHLK